MKSESTQLRRAFTKVSNALERSLRGENKPSYEVPIIKTNMKSTESKT